MDWILTHAEDASARLPDYLRLPKLVAFVQVLARPHQTLEDALRTLLEGWWLANAVGAQLDGIGELLDEPRGALGDAEYKLRLQARIRLLRGNATPDELLSLVLLLHPTLSPSIAEEYPAGAELLVAGGALPYPTVMLSLVGALHPSGVRLLLRYQSTDDADAFTLGTAAGDTDGLDVARVGLSSLASPTVGGVLGSSKVAGG